jgi:hypothetical protein
MTESKKGDGTVLAPGMADPVATLPEGAITVTIDAVVGENDGLFVRDENGNLVLEDGEPVPAPSENFMVRCVYPDGFAKNHQVATPADLAPKVIGILRGRFGKAGEINVLSLPEELAVGQTLTLEG